MDWFIVTDLQNKKHLINSSMIMDINYNKDDDIVGIDFIRAGYGTLYVKGNAFQEIKRLLNSHDHYVSQIGV